MGIKSANDGINIITSKKIVATTKAAILGQGKISSHIPKIFHKIFDSFIFLDKSLSNTDGVTSVFLAVQDQNIESVYLDIKNKFSKNTVFYHLSGALSFETIVGIHPLMTFSKDSDIKNYSKIPLYTDSNYFYEKNKNRLKNLNYISALKKTEYHAMAVMVGNFTQYYLQTIKKNFPEDLDFLLYKDLTLKSVESVFTSSSEFKLTGPMVRKDTTTILKHKKTLAQNNHKLLKIYESMERLFQQELFAHEN